MEVQSNINEIPNFVEEWYLSKLNYFSPLFLDCLVCFLIKMSKKTEKIDLYMQHITFSYSCLIVLTKLSKLCIVLVFLGQNMGGK